MTNYIIMCRVSGGVTGTRKAPFKSLGEIQVFDSREEAEKRASALMQSANSPNLLASFEYWVEEK